MSLSAPALKPLHRSFLTRRAIAVILLATLASSLFVGGVACATLTDRIDDICRRGEQIIDGVRTICDACKPGKPKFTPPPE